MVRRGSAENVVTFPRRQFLRLVASAASLPVAARTTAAQNYPTRPVRIFVGTPAGGATDIPTRLMSQWLSERLGQSVLVENRPGANIATEAVVRSAPDGHMLLAVTVANTVNATLYEKLGFNFIRDIAPVAGILTTPSVMLVHPAIPANSVPAFIAYAKANPGRINMASAGNGTTPHVAGELFKMRAGIDMVHVPYRGGAAALTDLVAGQVHVYFGATSGSIEYIKAGTVRALAVTSATRSELLPDIPTVGDFLPNFEATVWLGIGAAKNTPAEIVDRLNREINAGLADPRVKARFVELGATALGGSPSDFGKLIADETAKWARVVRFAGIKAD
jgi:tripartite-type tricarboxylate transporter receptor subunit TctC